MAFKYEPFNNSIELRNEISEKIKIIKQYFGQRYKNITAIVSLSVDKSTYRSYVNNIFWTPSSVFRCWAIKTFDDGGDLRVLLFNLKTIKDFTIFHNKMCESLSNYWNEYEPFPLSYAQVRKLVDLLVKHFLLWEELCGESRQVVLNNTNVPLDKFSLFYLREIAKGSGISIGKNPSMGDVDCDNYKDIQKIIRKSVGDYPPIYYDLVSWNRDHDFKNEETPRVISRDKIPNDNRLVFFIDKFIKFVEWSRHRDEDNSPGLTDEFVREVLLLIGDVDLADLARRSRADIETCPRN